MHITTCFFDPTCTSIKYMRVWFSCAKDRSTVSKYQIQIDFSQHMSNKQEYEWRLQKNINVWRSGTSSYQFLFITYKYDHNNPLRVENKLLNEWVSRYCPGMEVRTCYGPTFVVKISKYVGSEIFTLEDIDFSSPLKLGLKDAKEELCSKKKQEGGNFKALRRVLLPQMQQEPIGSSIYLTSTSSSFFSYDLISSSYDPIVEKFNFVIQNANLISILANKVEEECWSSPSSLGLFLKPKVLISVLMLRKTSAPLIQVYTCVMLENMCMRCAFVMVTIGS
jgi:hypothetical protein